MNLIKKICMDCAFFSLASEGLELDSCRLFDKKISRKEARVKTDCSRFILREENKDVEFYVPGHAKKKAQYEEEIKRYSIYMLVLLLAGVILFYLITRAV